MINGGKRIMLQKFLLAAGTVMVALAFTVVMTPQTAAQGKGHGSGGGGGASPSRGGPPPGAGVDRGISRSSDASMGRSDTGRANASDRSNGRSDAGIERARMANENLKTANDDLRRHPEIASDMHVTANDLRAGYQTALATNPNLKFGQYVAATRLAANLGRNNPAITRDAILAGLAGGHSIGQTLQGLGLSKDQSKSAQKQVDEQIKHSKRKS
jgi:hypothetical protein